MLIDHATLDQIRRGKVSLAFRRWKRPTVKAGGRLRTAVGELSIDAVDPVSESEITDAQAKKAGHGSKAELLERLRGRSGTLYRVRLHYAGPDAREALRNDADLSDDDVAALRKRLARMDVRSPDGAWTAEYLMLINERPATRAADLAASLGLDKPKFKARVRRLKELGLTRSLEVGYELSPRGRALLARLGS